MGPPPPIADDSARARALLRALTLGERIELCRPGPAPSPIVEAGIEARIERWRLVVAKGEATGFDRRLATEAPPVAATPAAMPASNETRKVPLAFSQAAPRPSRRKVTQTSGPRMFLMVSSRVS